MKRGSRLLSARAQTVWTVPEYQVIVGRLIVINAKVNSYESPLVLKESVDGHHPNRTAHKENISDAVNAQV